MTKKIKAYLVGGAVRDRLMGLTSKDLDYAVEAPSYEAMVEWILERGGKIFLPKPEFWTVRAQMPGKGDADFVLCRKDGKYSDGRRPDSVLPGNILEDLGRRDFTVNAIAFDDEDGSYIDPFNGRSDIENKWLRCVGSARDRFEEDALRMLRAIRFAITKNFTIDATIHNALQDSDLLARLRDNVSLDRVREELTRCFKYDSYQTLQFLNKYSALTKACFHSQKLWLLPTSKEV